MPKFSNTRLSDTAIRNLKPGRERYEVLDASQPGFGIRVSKTGIKSWIVYGRINGKRSRKTLGTYPSLSLADARIRAREALQSMRDGDQLKEARPLLFTEALELWYEREQSNRRSFNNVRKRFWISQSYVARCGCIKASDRASPYLRAGSNRPNQACSHKAQSRHTHD